MSFYLLTHPGPPITKWYTTRRKPIQIVVVHTAENLPDFTPQDRGAESVARYGASTDRTVSWHATVDSDSIISMLPDSYTAFHVRGYNAQSLGVEIATRARLWSDAPPVWVDRVIANLAQIVGLWCDLYNIPKVRIGKDAVDAGGKGIVAHADLDPQRRTDPGAEFPWGLLFNKLGVEESTEMVLKQGDTGNAVTLFQNCLNVQGAGQTMPADGIYGPQTVAAVKRYQQAANLPQTGEIDGIVAALLVRYDR